jgi:hypothetical protein
MVEFPVFVVSRDSGEMVKFADAREIERRFERIDVENGEFVAWDRQARRVSLEVREGPRWLALGIGEQAMPEFQAALRRFAGVFGLEVGREDPSAADVEAMFESVAPRVAQRVADKRTAARWRWGVFALLSAWLAWVLCMVPPSMLAGGFLLALGAMNILLHRLIGRQMFAWSRPLPAFAARFWALQGERGVQVFYLGIGIILAIGGCVLLIRSV